MLSDPAAKSYQIFLVARVRKVPTATEPGKCRTRSGPILGCQRRVERTQAGPGRGHRAQDEVGRRKRVTTEGKSEAARRLLASGVQPRGGP